MHVCIHLSCLSHSAFRCCPGPTGRHLCAASLPGLWQGCAKASTCFDHLLQMIPYARERCLLPAFYSSAYTTIVPDIPTIQKCISSAWPPERRFSTKKWKMKIALVVALSQQTGAYILKWCAFMVTFSNCVPNQSLGTGPVHKSGYLLSRPLECERFTCTWRNVGREHGVSLQTSQTSPRRLTIIETC